MSPLTFAVGVLALAALIGVLLLAQRLRRVEQWMRAHERGHVDLEPVRKREAAKREKKRTEEEQRAARH
ncbi:hypothetical protein WMF38_57205 [Sorangium sp. So ce118]